MNRRVVAVSAAVLLVIAGTVGGCDINARARLRDPGTGSKVADPSRPYTPMPGTPAVASDGSMAPTQPRVATNEPRRETTPPAPSNPTPPETRPAPTQKPIATNTKPAEREPAVDLEGTERPKPIAQAKPENKPEVRPETKPAPTTPVKPDERTLTAPEISLTNTPPKPAVKPDAKPATPSRPIGRDPAIDLVEGASTPAGNKPAPSTPVRPATDPTPNPGELRPTETQPDGRSPAVSATAPGQASSLTELREIAIGEITRISRADEDTLRANAVEAAGLAASRLESVITGGLRDKNAGVRAVAAMTVAKQKLYSLARQATPLLNDPSPYAQSAAVMAMAACNEPVDDKKVSGLAQILWTSESTQLRSHVAFVLGEIGNSSALPMLKQAASAKLPKATPNEVNLMLLQFAEAMVKLGDSSQIETIRAALHPSRPDDLECAALAAQILGELKDKKPVDQLVYLSAYKDPVSGQTYPPEVRMQIAASLAKLGLDRGGFIADEYAASPNALARGQAASVYGDTGRPEHVQKLAKLLADPEDRVRIAAAAAILKVHRRAQGLDVVAPIGGGTVPANR